MKPKCRLRGALFSTSLRQIAVILGWDSNPPSGLHRPAICLGANEAADEKWNSDLSEFTGRVKD